MPLGGLLMAIAALGLGLALFHPALGLIGVMVLANWIYWRYFSWLQCDGCSRFYFGGQLSGKPRATRPWTRSELRSLALKIAVASGALLVVFIPLRWVEQTTRVNCASECAQAGTIIRVFFYKCTCVPRAK